MNAAELDRERLRLRETLDEEPWRVLRVLADVEEESGNLAPAQGYRWLADRRKWPGTEVTARLHVVNYLWHYGETSEYVDGKNNSILPVSILKCYATPSEAWHGAAQAVGEWLVGGAAE